MTAGPSDPSGDREAQFWNRVAPKYAQMRIRDTETYAEKLRRTRAHLSKDMDVLELGCGTGSTALALAPDVGHIRATDFSETMLQIAREKARTAGIDNVSFERLDAQSPLADTPRYDAVLAFNVLHLVPDPDRVLARIAEALKPGGVFISGTFCFADDMRLFRPLAWAGHSLGLLPRLRFLGSDQLTGAMIAQGLDVVETWKPGRAKSVFLVARRS